MDPDLKLRTERETADILSCSEAALRRWRRLGTGPAFVKIGRLIRYSEQDLAAWIGGQRKATGDVEEAQ